MNSQHLSDEAVAAFADGVLRGHARDRATRHVEGCSECRSAVRSQREAVLALRSAPAPALPTGLFERLRALPATTPITSLPTAVADDGSTMLATFAAASGFPAAALVPPPAPAKVSRSLRSKPFVTGAAVVALTAGALAAGALNQPDPTPAAGGGTHTVSTQPGEPANPALVGAYFVRP